MHVSNPVHAFPKGPRSPHARQIAAFGGMVERKKTFQEGNFACSPGNSAVLLIEDLIITASDVFLDDNQPGAWCQYRLTSLQILHELGIGKMAQAPLVPDQIVTIIVRWLPLFKSDVEDASYAVLLGKGFGEFCNGLDNVHFLCQAEDQTLCDTANPGKRILMRDQIGGELLACHSFQPEALQPLSGEGVGEERIAQTHPAPPSRAAPTVCRPCFVPMPSFARKFRDPCRSILDM